MVSVQYNLAASRRLSAIPYEFLIIKFARRDIMCDKNTLSRLRRRSVLCAATDRIALPLGFWRRGQLSVQFGSVLALGLVAGQALTSPTLGLGFSQYAERAETSTWSTIPFVIEGSRRVYTTPTGSPAPPALLLVGEPSASEERPTRAIGAPQLPGLFSRYPVRPAWKVAGVDYRVGAPLGSPLKDPSAISMPDVFVDAIRRIVTITGDHVLLSGYDFSSHGGYMLQVKGAGDTIANSNFELGSNATPFLIQGTPSSSDLTIEGCTFDEASIGNATSQVGFAGAGKLIIKNNWFKNFPQHVLELAQRPGVSFSVLYEYNLIQNGGLARGAHLNYLQFGSGYATSVSVVFNTSYQTPQATGGEGYQFYDNAYGGRIGEVTLAYNTMIATGGSAATPAMSFLVHGNTPSLSGRIYNNYFDATAAYGVFYSNTFLGAEIFKNIDLNTGKIISP